MKILCKVMRTMKIVAIFGRSFRFSQFLSFGGRKTLWKGVKEKVLSEISQQTHKWSKVKKWKKSSKKGKASYSLRKVPLSLHLGVEWTNSLVFPCLPFLTRRVSSLRTCRLGQLFIFYLRIFYYFPKIPSLPNFLPFALFYDRAISYLFIRSVLSHLLGMKHKFNWEGSVSSAVSNT